MESSALPQLQSWQVLQRTTMNASVHFVRNIAGLEEADQNFNSLSRFDLDFSFDYKVSGNGGYIFFELLVWIHPYICVLSIKSSIIVISYCSYAHQILKPLVCFNFQPLVPAISAIDGEWLVSEPFMPVCKPGGHGVIWKLAYDKGVFQWFYNHGRKGATVRQVRSARSPIFLI